MKKVYEYLKALYKREPVRINALIVSALVAVAGSLHFVLNPESIAVIVPILLGSEAARTQTEAK